MVGKQTSFFHLFHNLKVPKENPASQTRTHVREKEMSERRERKVEPWVWGGRKGEGERKVEAAVEVEVSQFIFWSASAAYWAVSKGSPNLLVCNTATV